MQRKFQILIFLPLSIIFQIHLEIMAQSLSLYNAIQYALNHNKTIMYSAKQNFLSANAQLNSVNALYNTIVNAQASFSRSFIITQTLDPISGVELNRPGKYQQIYPGITLQQTFLTPLGSKLIFSGGFQTVASGISNAILA